MVKKPELAQNLINSANQKFEALFKLQSGIKQDIQELIVACVGLNEPITFNDETTFPSYSDDSDPMDTAIVAIMVEGNAQDTTGQILKFNACCGDDNYGLNPEAWFNPDNYGTYDAVNLLACITNWMEINK